MSYVEIIQNNLDAVALISTVPLNTVKTYPTTTTTETVPLNLHTT